MKKAKQVLVGLKNMDHAVELADTACGVAAQNASVLFVHVIEIPDATPLDAELPQADADAQKILNTGARVVRRSRLRVRTLVLRARSAGRALLETIIEEKSDLAVMGWHRGKSLGEFLFGTTHQFLAKHAPCQMLISIPPEKAAKAARAA
ncbi:MAG: universal stress protein [Candidatus Acidiferrales bacterium]